MPTNIYVDGFNVYYGCLHGTPYRGLTSTHSVVGSSLATLSTI